MAKKMFFRSAEEPSEVDELIQRQEAALQVTEPQAPGETEEKASETLLDVVRAEKRSFLEEHVVITGTIQSLTTIEIDGVLNGDVICENDVVVCGTVTGNIRAANVRLLAGTVEGNVDCGHKVALSSGTVIAGDVAGESIECNGKVRGNIAVTGDAVIFSGAQIEGDLCAAAVTVDKGALLNGTIKMELKTRAEAVKPAPAAEEPEESRTETADLLTAAGLQ